jgi:DNA-binding NarL/FixJ family response regulator
MSELDDRPSPAARRGRAGATTSILRRDGDWAGVLEAAQQAVRDDNDWARSVANAAKGLFITTHEPSLGVVQHSPSCDSANYLALSIPSPAGRRESDLSVLGVSGFRAFYYPPTTATTHLEIQRRFSPEMAIMATEFRRRLESETVDVGVLSTRRLGVRDAVGLFAYPEPGIIVSLFAPHDGEISLSRYERTLLARVALHLETSYRLRRRPEVLKAVLDLDGRVLERSDDAPDSHLLTAHAASVTRTRQRQPGTEALDLWPALVSGRLSLVERGSGAKRRYLLVENPAPSQPFRALSPTEVEVVSQAARGHTTKMIAYALGVSPSAVSTRLASAAAKIGASSRMELVRVAAMLTHDPRARFVDIALSDAERDVLELLQHGLSNEEIAKMRSRSVHTIANQVASLLRKTKSTSRRALVVRPRATRSGD